MKYSERKISQCTLPFKKTSGWLLLYIDFDQTNVNGQHLGILSGAYSEACQTPKLELVASKLAVNKTKYSQTNKR